MTVLRLFFDASPTVSGASARAFRWALFDDQGTCVREGVDAVERWPRQARREAVLAADLAPVLAFKLPPLSASRLDSAIRMQLEDRLATPLSTQHIIISPQQRDGWVRVMLVERTLLEVLRQFNIIRAISEAELIGASDDAWHWCVSSGGCGFVRRDRKNGGSTFALDLPPAAANHETPPVELTLALSAEAAKPKKLNIHAPLSSKTLASWQKACLPCRLTAEPPWRWSHAKPALFDQATDLLPHSAPAAPSSPRAPNTHWRFAALLVGTALALHVMATGIAWGSALWEHWQLSRGWKALAAEAGLPGKADNTTIPVQWSRAYADTRHRAGLAAPDDAMPLLARAAPFLHALPPGTLRNAVYADHAWTLEYTSLDATTQKSLETGLNRAGLAARSNNATTGVYRLRIQPQEHTP